MITISNLLFLTACLIQCNRLCHGGKSVCHSIPLVEAKLILKKIVMLRAHGVTVRFDQIYSVMKIILNIPHLHTILTKHTNKSFRTFAVISKFHMVVAGCILTARITSTMVHSWSKNILMICQFFSQYAVLTKNCISVAAMVSVTL